MTAAGLRVVPQQVSAAKIVHKEHCTELDSHTDMCVVGSGAFVHDKTGDTIDIAPYDATIGTRSYKVVLATVAYDDYTLGHPVLLTINQAVYIPKMANNLYSQCNYV